MDIEGLGEKIVDQLVEQGLVKHYGDLYRLTAEQLASLERMGTRSAQKLIGSDCGEQGPGTGEAVECIVDSPRRNYGRPSAGPAIWIGE